MQPMRLKKKRNLENILLTVLGINYFLHIPFSSEKNVLWKLYMLSGLYKVVGIGLKTHVILRTQQKFTCILHKSRIIDRVRVL